MTGARVAQHARRAVGAAAALHRHAELELQAFEADRARLGGTMDVVVRNAAADADDHGNGLPFVQRGRQLAAPICDCR